MIEATARLLVEEGYDKTTTNKVAARAGVSVGSLYQYFDDKDQLIYAVAERHHQQLMQVLLDAATEARGRPLAEVVALLTRAMVDVHAVDPALHCVVTEQVPREVIHCRVEADGAAFVRGLLEDHRTHVRKDLDLDVATFVIVHAVEGITHAAVLERTDLLDDGRLARDTAAMLTRYLAAP